MIICNIKHIMINNCYICFQPLNEVLFFFPFVELSPRYSWDSMFNFGNKFTVLKNK